MVARADKAHYNPSCAVLFQRGTFTSHAAGDIKDAHMPRVDKTLHFLKWEMYFFELKRIDQIFDCQKSFNIYCWRLQKHETNCTVQL